MSVSDNSYFLNGFVGIMKEIVAMFRRATACNFSLESFLDKIGSLSSCAYREIFSVAIL